MIRNNNQRQTITNIQWISIIPRKTFSLEQISIIVFNKSKTS